MPAIKAALAKADGARIKAQLDAGETFTMKIEDGEKIEFAHDDVKVHTTFDAQLWVFVCQRITLLSYLTPEINEELFVEGIARELVHTVQDTRKSAGLGSIRPHQP